MNLFKLLLLLTLCVLPLFSIAQDFPFTKIFYSEYEQMPAQTIICKSEADLKNIPAFFRNKIGKIDFEKDYLILLAVGEKNSGGYGIQINAISCKRKNLQIKYSQIKPSKDSMQTMALTYPVLIGTIPNRKCKKFTFIEE